MYIIITSDKMSVPKLDQQTETTMKQVFKASSSVAEYW